MNHKEREEWLASLNVGDEVCYDTGSYGRREMVIGKITKITPTRRMDVGSFRFDKFGREMGEKSAWRSSKTLFPVTDEIREEIERKELIRQLKEVNLEFLSLSKLRDIMAIYKSDDQEN